MSETVQTAFRWVDIRPSKVLFQSAPALPRLTLFWPSLFQEYFYKSQESLATVIDFVEEKVEKKKKRKEGSEATEEEKEDLEECSNTSTHSSPLFPASRKRPKNLDPRRRLTPWMTGLTVWSLLLGQAKLQKVRKHGANIFHLEHNISQLFKVRILRYISNSLFAQQWATYKTLLVYLASKKASASYQQIFVEFNQKCETTVELIFKHGQLPLSTFVPCVFLYVFTIFDARIETGKTRGQCFCTY